MKKYLLILATALCSFISPDGKPLDRLSVKGPLSFNETSFELAWTDHPKAMYYIQEYVPTGEKVEHFNQMMTIHLFDTDIELTDAVQQKINELNERKKTDPTCQFMVNKSPDGKEFMVDFLLGESSGNEMTIVEFNIYRYKQVELGNNKKGILVYTYSKRAYGNDITPFYKNLGSDRTKLLNAMIGTEMPTITITETALK